MWSARTGMGAESGRFNASPDVRAKETTWPLMSGTSCRLKVHYVEASRYFSVSFAKAVLSNRRTSRPGYPAIAPQSIRLRSASAGKPR
jgi:hypothetical protein